MKIKQCLKLLCFLFFLCGYEVGVWAASEVDEKPRAEVEKANSSSESMVKFWTPKKILAVKLLFAGAVSFVVLRKMNQHFAFWSLKGDESSRCGYCQGLGEKVPGPPLLPQKHFTWVLNRRAMCPNHPPWMKLLSVVY